MLEKPTIHARKIACKLMIKRHQTALEELLNKYLELCEEEDLENVKKCEELKDDLKRKEDETET